MEVQWKVWTHWILNSTGLINQWARFPEIMAIFTAESPISFNSSGSWLAQGLSAPNGREVNPKVLARSQCPCAPTSIWPSPVLALSPVTSDNIKTKPSEKSKLRLFFTPWKNLGYFPTELANFNGMLRFFVYSDIILDLRVIFWACRFIESWGWPTLFYKY